MIRHEFWAVVLCAVCVLFPSCNFDGASPPKTGLGVVGTINLRDGALDNVKSIRLAENEYWVTPIDRERPVKLIFEGEVKLINGGRNEVIKGSSSLAYDGTERIDGFNGGGGGTWSVGLERSKLALDGESILVVYYLYDFGIDQKGWVLRKVRFEKP